MINLPVQLSVTIILLGLSGNYILRTFAEECSQTTLETVVGRIGRTIMDEMKALQALDQVISKCVGALQEGNHKAGTKYWKLILQLQSADDSLQEIIEDVYRGKPENIQIILDFINKNLGESRNSDLATFAYKFLLEEMTEYGDLFLDTKDIIDSRNSNFKRVTFSTLRQITQNLGFESEVSKSLPRVAISILQGKSLILKNKGNRDALYLRPEVKCTQEEIWSNCSDRIAGITTAVLISLASEKPKGFLWKFLPLVAEDKGKLELFTIKNDEGDKRVHFGSIPNVVDGNRDDMLDDCGQFYIHILSQNEIMIQCSAEGLKFVVADEESDSLELVEATVGETEIADRFIWVVEIFEEKRLGI